MSTSDAHGVFSSWKRWQVDAERGNRSSSPGFDLRHPLLPLANTSRSDPESHRTAGRKCSRDEYLDDKLYGTNEWSNNPHSHQRTPTSRTAACQFSRCSSYTEGFRTENEDDEPSDTLVWDSTRKLYPSRSTNSQRHEALLDDDRLSMARVTLPGSKPSDYDGQLAGVAQQLERIKTTQDSILSELSNDISSLQFENVQLKNTNEHLTMQNSHLLQVINELSQEVESMRQIFRNRGWTVGMNAGRISKERISGSSSKSQPVSKNTGVFTVKSRGRKDLEAEPSRTGMDDGITTEAEESACESPIPGDDQVHKLSNTGLNRERGSSSHKSHKSRRSVKSTKSSGVSESGGKHSSSRRKREEVIPEELEVEDEQGCLRKLFSSKKNKRKSTPRSFNNNEMGSSE